MIQNWFKLINILDVSWPNIVFFASLFGLFLLWKNFPKEVRFIVQKIFEFIINLLPPIPNHQQDPKPNPLNSPYQSSKLIHKNKIDLEEELRNLDKTITQNHLSVSPRNLHVENRTISLTQKQKSIPSPIPSDLINQDTNQITDESIKQALKQRDSINVFKHVASSNQAFENQIPDNSAYQIANNSDQSNFNSDNFNPYLIQQQKNSLGDLGEFIRKDSFLSASQNAIQNADSNRYDYSANACNAVFFPPIEVKGNVIPRFKQLAYLKNALVINEVVFLIGPSGTGKTFLSTLCAKELRYAQSYSILSFSFTQQNNSLLEGLRSILIEQLKFPDTSIQDPIQDFFKVLAEDLCLVIFRNIEFLSNNELLLLCSSPHLRGGSRIIVISNHLSEKTLKQIGLNHLSSQDLNNTASYSQDNNQFAKQQDFSNHKDNYWVELDELDLESTQEYLLDKLPQSLNLNSLFMNKLIRHTKGSPLLVKALCFFVIRQVRQTPWIKAEEIIKIIETTKVNSPLSASDNEVTSNQLSRFDRAIMSNSIVEGSQKIASFMKIIRLVFASLSELERDILLFCAYTPLESFSISLIKKVFKNTIDSGIPNVKDNQNNFEQNISITDLNVEILQAINYLSESGLIQKNHTEAFVNPNFFINESVKNLIYREFPNEFQQDCQTSFKHQSQEGTVKIINYFVELLQDNETRSKERAKESISFISSGLLFSARATLDQVSLQAHNKSIFTQVNAFHEKIIDYFALQGSFYEYIEKHLIPIYQEGFAQADSITITSQENKFQEIQALWQRLWAISLIKITEGRNIPFSEKYTQLNLAIELLGKALRTYLSGYAPINSAQIYNDLGTAHLKLSESQKTEENVIQAIDYYKKALDIQESNKSPKDQSCQIQSYTQLGNAYLKLYKLKPLPITINLAIQIFSKVLKFPKESLSLRNKSFIHQNIGNALRNLAIHEDQISNLQEAINNYKSALEGACDLKLKAIIYNSLGCCLWKLAKYHNTVRNIELAISAYRKSLEFISHSWNPLVGSKESIEYATTQNNLGTCYKALASLKEPEENLSLAMKYFKESLYIAETTSQQRLVQVINQHLSELSNLADQMIFKKVSDSRLIEAQSQT